MKKNKNNKSLTWKHVFTIVLTVWLFTSLIGGERLKIGELAMGIGGCQLQSKHIERETKGLDL